MQISAALSSCTHTHLVRLSVSVWFQRLKINLARDQVGRDSLFHDLAVRFDRFAARQKTILFRDLHIAHVHGHCIGGPTQMLCTMGFLL